MNIDLVEIPSGSFLMGSPSRENPWEHPAHQVTLEGFFMGRTPITQAQWREVASWAEGPGERWEGALNPNPSNFKGYDRPVESVNWFDAMEFCNRLSQRTGCHYTLPSEAQWEYACRAGTTTAFHFGDTITTDLANYDGTHDCPKGKYRKQTTPVGMFPANDWGLHDMHGNVWEWCLDYWHSSYDGAPTDGSAWLGYDNPGKVLRGGSWYHYPVPCRSASRDLNRPANADYLIGFRVVRIPCRLGGRWADFAERVETAREEAERRSRQAEAERLLEEAEQRFLPCSEEEFHFSVARLQWIDVLPPLPGQREKSPQARGFLEPLNPSLDLQLVEIPAGRFLMGSPLSEEGRRENEGPQHEVTLESFFLGRTPITQAQWREVAGWVEGPGERWGLDLSGKLKPSFFRGDTRPVERVNWFEAMEFCSRLSQRSGKFYTLPSEAQWEYACRAGSTTPFHCGETLSDKLANYNAAVTYGRGRKGQSQGETTEVGRFPANDWGLHDMHGNVWEWCEDHWHGSYDLGQRQAPGDGSPWLDAAEPGLEEEKGRRSDERTRVLRGGSWDISPVLCRSAYRFSSHPANAVSIFGFRVCCLP